MKSLLSVTVFMLGLALSGEAVAGEAKHDKLTGTKMQGMSSGDQGEGMQHSKEIVCSEPPLLMTEAETKPGGANYKGPLPKQAMEMGTKKMGAVRVASDKLAANLKNMAEMAGAHNMHKGVRGGELFMVPNQLHHIEVVYSRDCGYQLFFYNAFTEPIRADRFHAFMIILPEEGDDFFEVMRFLTPSEDGSHLVSNISHSHDGPKPKGIFETELYVKFPESVEPMVFEAIVGTEVTWE
ncbi:MAG: hypothetical protein ACTSW2_05870 [Alphaproteobacteria bacterium]